MTKDGDTGGATKYFFAMVSIALFFLRGMVFKTACWDSTNKANKGLLAVLRIHTRHNIPHNGTDVVARPTLRLSLRFPRRRRSIHHPLVRGIHLGGYVERRRYQRGSKEGKHYGWRPKLHDIHIRR
jgi:hypothetical protein